MANAVRDLFEANGIPAMIRSFQIPAYDGLARVMRPVWGEVLVAEENLARARELLDAFLTTDAGDAGKQGLWLKNDKGVTLHMKSSRAEGIALSIGVEGFKITMK